PDALGAALHLHGLLPVLVACRFLTMMVSPRCVVVFTGFRSSRVVRVVTTECSNRGLVEKSAWPFMTCRSLDGSSSFCCSVTCTVFFVVKAVAIRASKSWPDGIDEGGVGVGEITGVTVGLGVAVGLGVEVAVGAPV